MAQKIETRLHTQEGENQYELVPRTHADQVDISAPDGSDSTVAAQFAALWAQVTELAAVGGAPKGYLTSTSALPTLAYKAGWKYIVKEAGTYAGQSCEPGDMILCLADYAAGSASNSDWLVLQANISGAVSGPASSTVGHVAIFDSATGKVIKDSGFTLGKSVPADAQFTDTTYGVATAEKPGLYPTEDMQKLAGIEAGADKTDAENVAAAGAFMRGQNNTDDITQGTNNLFYTLAERQKLAGISVGAQPNQNAFASVTVGDDSLTASAPSGSFGMEAGDGITVSLNKDTGAVKVAEKYVDTCLVSSLAEVPVNLRDGGLIIVRS